MRVVGCFLEFEGKFVILHRRSHKPDGNTWGLPSGKVESNETDLEAVIRELQEETGYKADASELSLIGEFDFVTSRGEPSTYVPFRLTLKTPHSVRLEEEAHSDSRWVTPEECDAMPDLIPGLHLLLRKTGHLN